MRIVTDVLETLAVQGFIDVGPTERGYDLTLMYDFLVTCGIAERVGEKYWLRLVNEDACLMLAKILKRMSWKAKKRKHDKELVLKIIREFGTITSGELHDQYHVDSGKIISLRHLLNITKELEQEGRVTRRVLRMGRYGRTTEISPKTSL